MAESKKTTSKTKTTTTSSAKATTKKDISEKKNNKLSAINESLKSFSTDNDTVKTNHLKTNNSKGLGKGLDVLLPKKIATPTEDENVSRETLRININLIDPNPDQPRKTFDEDALQELAASIKEHDLIQPIVVKKEGDRYIIVAGERRWRASRLAGLKDVPVYIRDFTPQELYEAALIENIQRQDLNPIEEAEAYQVLITEYNLKQDEVAERVAKSRVAITNSLRLLNLDKRVRQLVVDGMLSGGHARALLSVKDGDIQYNLAMKVFDERLNVRDTEKLIKKYQSAKTPTTRTAEKNIDEILIHDLEEKLKRALGSKVTIAQKTGNKGSIIIDYYSADELDRIYDMLRNASLK